MVPRVAPRASILPSCFGRIPKRGCAPDHRSSDFRIRGACSAGRAGLSDAEFQTLAAQLSTHRLRALSGYNPIPGDLKLVGPDLNRTKQEAHIHHLLARASALTLTYVILKSGPRGVCMTASRLTKRSVSSQHSAVISQPRQHNTGSRCWRATPRHRLQHDHDRCGRAAAGQRRQPLEFRDDGRLLVSHHPEGRSCGAACGQDRI